MPDTLVITAFTLKWASNDSVPNSEPMPESFTPPQGEAGSSRWWSLIQKMPQSTRRAIRCARATSAVRTPAASPYGESLAMRTASSSVSNGITTVTGPNTSSRAMVIDGVTPANTVGSRKYPPASAPSRWAGRLPPVTACAPSCRAMSTRRSTRSRWRAEITGPICVSGSAGSPTRIAAALRASRSTNSSWMLRWTMCRAAQTQVWPAAMKAPNAA